MHLLASQPGGFSDEEGIIDLDQSPADIVILAAADSVLASLADSAESLPEYFPSIRLANWVNLLKPAAFDLYRDKVIDHAKIVVVSLLGGENYWQYGFEQLQEWAHSTKRHLIIVPGDDTPDPHLFSASTTSIESTHKVWRFLREGGALNHRHLLHFLNSELLHTLGEGEGEEEAPLTQWMEPQVLPRCLLYTTPALLLLSQSSSESPLNSLKDPSLNSCDPRARFNVDHASIASYQQYWRGDTPVVVLLFYRSHLQAANMSMFDALIEQVEAFNLNVLPIAINSLKDTESLLLCNDLIQQTQAAGYSVSLIMNTTGFASHKVNSPELASEPTSFSSPFNVDIPVLQLILSSSTEADWESQFQGLRSRDIAMQVVLPEMDGRIITRAISFKAESWFSERCQISVVRYALHEERASFVAALAYGYSQLASKDNNEKRVALILANYPTNDGRIGNGVGLDTPASTVTLLNALAEAGYPVRDIPLDGTALINTLLGAVTNNPNTLHQLPCWQSLHLDDYRQYFRQMPQANQEAVLERWGDPSADPKCRQERLMVSGLRLGETFVGIQPARGFNIDLAANYHDPDLVPPHSYLAFYFWLRHIYCVDAVIHMGKHGNVEWLPGKGSALSNKCWPDIALGPMPHFYPFIVNDPGEGAQAKRRTQAVIIDHLMPPMTRADTYGELAELEALVDEYYQAMGLDVRREQWLKQAIVEKAKDHHLLEEIGVLSSQCELKDEDGVILEKLDAYLCEIKEAQIRHGLHRLGQLPDDDKLADTILALLRLPRTSATDNSQQNSHSQGILHNLIYDLDLQVSLAKPFDPLRASAEPWYGSRPAILENINDQLWRTEADTRERLEHLAVQFVKEALFDKPSTDKLSDDSLLNEKPSKETSEKPNEGLNRLLDENSFPRTYAQLQYAKTQLMTALNRSAEQEVQAIIHGLSGGFIEPGPSGAPTRGRLDTLPTGRNFFSVDNRSIPSPAACALGELSAQQLIERHLQEHGDYPKQLGLSVWGTATMRTGGDDIAQAFALMGVKPIRAEGSQRVVDVEIIPSMLLGRPRVDVTLRVSGFFRDAFPNVMRLYDTAVLALASYDESGEDNVIQKNIQQRADELVAEGMALEQAQRQASYRVFGSKPGAYGAGLQGLIDERCWETRADLAEAYVNWGGYAYGNDASDRDGVQAMGAFEHQLSQLEVVIQNQDNREHDLLDSDDYYQFQGGMTNAVTEYAQQAPTVYHGDHSNPSAPTIRTLQEELNRVIRSRVLNPKWINAMQTHGYKGAFEMAATVDYLFAYDATTDLIADYQYQQVSDALLFDEENRAFIEEHNPNALEAMAERLLEATQRGMWQNPEGYSEKLQDLLLGLDEKQEKGEI